MKIEITVETWKKACDRIRARFPRKQGSVTSMMLKKEYNMLSNEAIHGPSAGYPHVRAILVEFATEADATVFLLRFA